MSKRLKKEFSAYTDSEVEMDKAARIMRSELVSNFRDGLGSDDAPFPKLKNSTINRRGEIAEFNRTGARYNQFFSNITLTGAFVKSFKVIATKTLVRQSRRFEMFFSGVHQGYKNADGERSTAVDNSKIFQGLRSRGWKLTGVTAKAQNRIRQQFIRFLRRRKK